MMKRLKPGLLMAVCLFFAACEGHLPSSLHREIAGESDRLREAGQQLQRTQDQVGNDLTKNSDLFRNVSAPGEWAATLRGVKEKLDRAEQDKKQLEELARRDRGHSREQAERILRESRKLR